MSRRTPLLAAAVLACVAAACRPQLRGEAASCTRVQATREVQGVALCEDVWTCGRPPGGRFDRVGLRRVALCEAATGPVVLYLPGMHQNGRIPVADPEHDLRLFLARAGFRTWGLDWRSHAVPPTASTAELAGLAGWSAEVFTADASWAAAFARTHDQAPVWLAGFSYGAGVAYRLAAARDAGIAGLVVLDGTAPASRELRPGDVAIDVGSSRLPWDARERLLATVMRDPAAPSPLAGYPDAGSALADVLWSSQSFGGEGGLSAARAGVSDVRVVARVLAAYDRWWPRAALGGPAAGEPAKTFPVLAFATSRMGAEWTARVRASAERFGGPGTAVRLLEGYGHLDVLAGRRAAVDVFEPARAFMTR